MQDRQEVVVVTGAGAGLMDRWLARSAVGGQQTEEREGPERPDNLWQPVKGDMGARGRFGRESKHHSGQLWLTTHREQVGLIAGSLLLAGAAALCAVNRRQRQTTSRLSVRR